MIPERHFPPGRYISRTLAHTVAEAMAESRVVAVLGPRQAGKSTLVRRLSDQGIHASYLTLDDPAVLSLAASDPIGFLGGLESPVVIDEIQRAPELLLAIKTRVDQDDRRGQYLITGSANLRTIPTVADSLPGRVDYLTLWPFTQGELVGRREDFIDRLFAGNIPSVSNAPIGKSSYSDLLLKGGYPEAQRRNADSRTRFFNSYLQSIVERDVPDSARLHEPAATADLLRLVASRSGSIARFDPLGQTLGLDGKTAKRYLQALERLFLIRIRRSWHRNLGKRQVKAPKIYVADTGLLAAVVGIDHHRLETNGGIAGSMFETFVATELERQAAWATEPYTFWHLRTGGREVDVVIERRRGDIAGVEVKSSATVRAGDFAGLKWLRDETGDDFRAGVVLYPGSTTLPFGDRLWAVPLQTLWQPDP